MRSLIKRRSIYIGIGALIIIAVFSIYFANRVYAFVTGPLEFTSTQGHGAMTHGGYNTVEGTGAAQITMNGQPVLEVQDPKSTGGYSMPGSYLYTQATTFDGSTGNPQFIKHILPYYAWTYNLQNNQPSPDWYAASDSYGLNGFMTDGLEPSFIPDGENVKLVTVPNPQLTASLSNSSIQPGTTYSINTNISHDGWNMGYYSDAFFSAYWVPIINGAPDTSKATYALQTNDSGNATIYGWPSLDTVINDNGTSNLHIGYPGGFPGAFEQVPFGYGKVLTRYANAVSPTSFPSGTTAYDLVVYYGDPIERYAAEVVHVNVATPPTPTAQLTVQPTHSQAIGNPFKLTVKINNCEAGGTLDIQTINKSTGTPITSGTPTFSGHSYSVSVTVPSGQPTFTYSTTVNDPNPEIITYDAVFHSN